MNVSAVKSPIEWATMLRDAGLKATSGRVAALQYLTEHPHCSASALHESIAALHPSLSQQSAHNIVRDLTAHGLLRRIELPGSDSALYETRVGDNHHHLVCVHCHRVEDINCTVGQSPCLEPDHTHGMRVLEASITFRGICADCERDSSSNSEFTVTTDTP
ncbi:MAG TPA: transcriptional repressor [Candidatus Agrococcus pullicola]|uniref:Transcriptional repressor n=1 Tax=Candidatus Agrococcus pullicola TaxID=2838429 RepID=A0A9D1YSX4_9MICO|nr:transcriptional repressor [Candidatus Agrococcus pullicola]